MNVNSEITVSLTDKDKEILIKAIELCEAIATDCNDNSDLWIDADTVFTCIRSNYKEGKLPTVNTIYE
jgi:hypothetical protein